MTAGSRLARRRLIACAAALPLGAGLTAVLAIPEVFGAEVQVIDGDTVRIDNEKMRLADANAPELHDPGCANELYLARQAKAALERLVAKGNVSVERRGFDRRGQMEALVRIDGVSVGSRLIELGLAKPRQGLSREREWCTGPRR